MGHENRTDFVVMGGATSDTTVRTPHIDAITHALINIDYAHHEIHDGDSFMGYHTLTGKNDGTYLTIYLKTPVTNPQVHMFTQWQASGAAYFRIREGAVVTSDTGSHKAVLNRNRTSSNTSGVFDNEAVPVVNKISTDVTIADRTASTDGDKGGLVIWEEYDGVGKSVAGGSRNEMEIILKANKAYVFEIESDALGLVLALQLYGYEHTPKTA